MLLGIKCVKNDAWKLKESHKTQNVRYFCHLFIGWRDASPPSPSNFIGAKAHQIYKIGMYVHT